MKHSPFTLIEAHHYPLELEQKLATAKKRVVLAAMVMYNDSITEDLFEHLKGVLQRGASVHLAPDAFNHYIFAPSGNVLAAQRQIKATDAVLQEMKARDAEVHFIGNLSRNPYHHRFHQKFTIIDDDVYFAGGINFSAEHFQHTDYMLHIKSLSLAETLIRQLKDVETGGDIANFSFDINSNSTLHIDGGTPGNSLIYDRAVALAREAESILYVSQWAPSGELATVLRKKQADCYFNRIAQAKGLAIASQIVDQARRYTKDLYQQDDYIHAKFMLFIMSGGKKVLLSGSHNFSQRGVDYGTKELALESTDINLWHQLEHFAEKYIF